MKKILGIIMILIGAGNMITLILSPVPGEPVFLVMGLIDILLILGGIFLLIRKRGPVRAVRQAVSDTANAGWLMYASFWQRLGALLIDGLLILPLFILLLTVARESVLIYMIMISLHHLVFMVYEVLMLKYFGATLGKMAVGITVRCDDGRVLGWKQIILRNGLNYLLSLGTLGFILVFLSGHVRNPGILKDWAQVIPGVYPAYRYLDTASTVWVWSELIFMLTNSRRKALHDWMAGTVVVKKSVVADTAVVTGALHGSETEG